MRSWWRSLDSSGRVFLGVVVILLVSLLYPILEWVFTPYRVYGIPTVEPPPRCTRPAGFARLEVPIQPRIEYIRYTDNPRLLSVRQVAFAFPFTIDVTINNGVCASAQGTGTGSPAFDVEVGSVCASWVGHLRYVFPLNARMRVTVYPGGQFRIEWITIDPASIPPCVPGMVCYAVSRSPQWSVHVLPINGLLVSVGFSPDARETWDNIANHCRNCLNLDNGFNI